MRAWLSVPVSRCSAAHRLTRLWSMISTMTASLPAEGPSLTRTTRPTSTNRLKVEGWACNVSAESQLVTVFRKPSQHHPSLRQSLATDVPLWNGLNVDRRHCQCSSRLSARRILYALLSPSSYSCLSGYPMTMLSPNPPESSAAVTS